MNVVVRAWHWGVTFATAKKLPSLAAGSAAILVRRISEARNGPRQIYRTTRRCLPSCKAIWSPDPRRLSNETQHHVDRRISALAPLPDASHYGRHRSWDIKGRELKHCVARPRGLPVRDTRAHRTAIGARHHAAHRIVRSSHARHAHEGGTLRRDRQIARRLFLRLDTLGARRAGVLHLDPLGARTVGSATEAAPVVRKRLTNAG